MAPTGMTPTGMAAGRRRGATTFAWPFAKSWLPSHAWKASSDSHQVMTK